MSPDIKKKILSLEELVVKVGELKRAGEVVVQSHGIFDLIHPGVLKHLNSAKSQGTVLIVTVIKDEDVRGGPNRPIFPDSMRLENVASLECVDFACQVDDAVPFESVEQIKAQIFAKGQNFKDRDQRSRKIMFEGNEKTGQGTPSIGETDRLDFSSSELIKNFLSPYPEETKQYLEGFSQKHCFEDIVKKLDSLAKMKVLVVGDGIIDDYHYCEPMGKAGKSNLVVYKHLNNEVFAGGAYAIANHISGLCEDVHIVSLLGKNDTWENFINDKLRNNISSKFFNRESGPTIVKKRYIHPYLNQKLFEINYIDDSYVSNEKELEIIQYLESVIPSYDLVIVSDFGHGFISEPIYKVLEKESKVLAINTQTNAANSGYNLITKYHNTHFVCLDEPEVRLAAQKKYECIEDVAKTIRDTINAKFLITTLGKKGSICINDENEVIRTPIFSTKVVDTIGAGDAFFAFTAPCVAAGMPADLISFIGNAVGALAVQIIGNKRPVDKNELLEFIHQLLQK